MISYHRGSSELGNRGKAGSPSSPATKTSNRRAVAARRSDICLRLSHRNAKRQGEYRSSAARHSGEYNSSSSPAERITTERELVPIKSLSGALQSSPPSVAGTPGKAFISRMTLIPKCSVFAVRASSGSRLAAAVGIVPRSDPSGSAATMPARTSPIAETSRIHFRSSAVLRCCRSRREAARNQACPWGSPARVQSLGRVSQSQETNTTNLDPCEFPPSGISQADEFSTSAQFS